MLQSCVSSDMSSDDLHSFVASSTLTRMHDVMTLKYLSPEKQMFTLVPGRRSSSYSGVSCGGLTHQSTSNPSASHPVDRFFSHSCQHVKLNISQCK